MSEHVSLSTKENGELHVFSIISTFGNYRRKREGMAAAQSTAEATYST